MMSSLLAARMDLRWTLDQAPKMDLFAKIVNGFKLTLLHVSVKSSVLDVCMVPEYISDLF